VVLRRRVVVFLVVLGADFFGAANFAFFGATLSVSVFATVSIIAGGDSTWGVISFAIFAGATVGALVPAKLAIRPLVLRLPQLVALP